MNSHLGSFDVSSVSINYLYSTMRVHDSYPPRACKLNGPEVQTLL